MTTYTPTRSAAKRDPLGPKELNKLLSGNETAVVMSAARGISGRNDKRRMQMLRRDLQEMGVADSDIRQTRGQWWSDSENRMRPEPSLVIKGLDFGRALALAQKYEQDAFIFKGEDGVIGMYEGYRESDEGGPSVTVPSQAGEPLFGSEALTVQPRKPKDKKRDQPKEPPEELFTGTRSNTFEFRYDWDDAKRNIPLDMARPVSKVEVSEHFQEKPAPAAEPGRGPGPAREAPQVVASHDGSHPSAEEGDRGGAAPAPKRRGRIRLIRDAQYEHTVHTPLPEPDDIDPALDLSEEEAPFDPSYELGGVEQSPPDPEFALNPSVFIPEAQDLEENLRATAPIFEEEVGFGSDLTAKSQLSDHTFADFEDRLQPNSADNIRAVLDVAGEDVINDYKDWYKDANAAARQIAERHGVPLETVVGVIAAISPNMPWLSNLRAADSIIGDPERYEELYRERDRIMRPLRDRLSDLNAAAKEAEDPEQKKELQAEAKYVKGVLREQAYKYMRVPGGAFYSSNFYKAKEILDGEREAIGPKVGVFYRSILDPDSMADTPTVDGHMANLWRNGREVLSKLKTVTENERQDIVDGFREVAPEYGLTPQQAHAVAWVVWRSAMDNQGRKRRPAQKAAGRGRVTLQRRTAMRVVHYSRAPDLKRLDPSYIGGGSLSRRERQDTRVPVTFFYMAGTEPEQLVVQSAKARYEGTIPDRLLDIGRNLPDEVREGLRRDGRGGMYQAIKDLGYFGFYNSESDLPNAVLVFYPVNVEATSMSKDNPFAPQPQPEEVPPQVQAKLKWRRSILADRILSESQMEDAVVGPVEEALHGED
jgi:hypothetical protein